MVAGLTLNGATVLRRMQALGNAPWGVSYDPEEQGWHVSGVGHRRVPDPREDLDGWVDALVELAGEFDEAPPLIPMSDVQVVALDEAAPRLEGHYRFHGFGSGLRTRLTSKRATFELAEQHDFPRPVSRWVESREELAAFAEELSGPVLIKPDLTFQWRNARAAPVVGESKVLAADDVDELLAEYDRVAFATPRILAQEVIPGPDENLLYWCGFVGPEGRVGGRLVGRKRRIVPIHFGSATYVELVDAPDVEDQCERFLTEMGYEGLCGVELKRDPRDGVAKLIEVNPRYSLWDDIGVPVGVDLALEAVESLRGAPTRRTRPRHFRQKWVELGRDLPAAVQYGREGLLTPWSWLWSLRPPIVVNDLPLASDPRYAMHMIWRRLRKLPTLIGAGGNGADRGAGQPQEKAPLPG